MAPFLRVKGPADCIKRLSSGVLSSLSVQLATFGTTPPVPQLQGSVSPGNIKSHSGPVVLCPLPP